MKKELEFQGPRGKDGEGESAAQIKLVPGEEWVYAERVKGVLQVWSGPACLKCQIQSHGVRRCRLHANTELIALQLRLW